MSPTILALWLPHLPTDRIARGRGAAGDAGPGLVTVAKVRGAQRIEAVDQAAAHHGLRPGMALADARAIRPGLEVCPADPAGDAACLDHLAVWCSRFTPLVATDGADGLLLDITGAAHLFGGNGALADTVVDGMRALGFAGRAAVASTAETAWAFARFGALRLVPDPADTKAFRKAVDPLPLAALRLDPEVVRTMVQAGLRQVGDLLWRPRAPLAARFGTGVFARLDAMMGLSRTPISPRFDPPAFVAEQRFASPVTLEADIHRAVLALSHHLCALMERQGQGARRIEARLFRVDGMVKRLTVGTSRPLTRPDDMARLFRERIAGLGEDGLDTGYGFDVVRLGVPVSEAAGQQQGEFLSGHDAGAAADIAGLVDRLGARLGTVSVTRLAGRPTHIPEDAAEAVPATRPSRPTRPLPSRRPTDPPPARPIRLFIRPEPIDTVAAVPDGPPLRFRWRRTVHEVAAVEGPERIAPEWWKSAGSDLTRDYFRAEDPDGRQFWLFREGLFTRETTQPRWYLHGLFG